MRILFSFILLLIAFSACNKEDNITSSNIKDTVVPQPIQKNITETYYGKMHYTYSGETLLDSIREGKIDVFYNYADSTIRFTYSPDILEPLSDITKMKSSNIYIVKGARINFIGDSIRVNYGYSQCMLLYDYTFNGKKQ